MKLFIRLYALQLKQYIKAMPLAILGSILFIALTAAASIGILKYNESPEDTLVKASVAVVATDIDESYMNMGLNMLGKMASTSDYFTFTVMDPDEAEKALSRGKIIAIINFPEGAVEGILDGTNDPVDIRFNDSNPLSSVLLTELTKSGATLLSGAQAGTYTTAKLFYDNDRGSELYGAFNDVDEIGFKLVLKRGALFDDDTSDTKSGNATIAYFLGTAVILVLIFFGLTLAGNIYYDNNAYLILGSSKKGFSIAYYAAKLLSLTTIYYLATSILLVVALKNEYIGSLIGKIDSAKLFLNPLLIALYISAFLSMLMFMMPRSMDGILLIFITSIVLTIASGLLIPVAFMPLIFTRLHGALPFTSLHSYIVSIIGLGDSYIPGIIYTLIFMIIGYLVLKIKIKNAS